MGRLNTYIGNLGGVRLLEGGRVWGPPLREPSKSGGGKPPPYGFPEIVLKLGRGAPWGSRRGHAPGSQRAGEGTRPYGVFTNGSTYRKRDRFLTCPLKHRGETQFRTKFLCFLSFSKKGSYTGPWRKRSIISWVREMADPPWGRFSRSNQVPSPSSSSWRVTVSSSVSRSQ